MREAHPDDVSLGQTAMGFRHIIRVKYHEVIARTNDLQLESNVLLRIARGASAQSR
jgi:hypothetical protein